jgi:hypothetical protein
MGGNLEENSIGRYAQELADRFGEAFELGGDVEDIPFVHQVLARRTHRKICTEAGRGTASPAADRDQLCASSKSDFQQASLIRLSDPQARAAIAALMPEMPGSAWSRSFSCTS